MPELRWILIIAGALLLLGIYLWGRHSSRQAVADDDALLRSTESPLEPQGTYALRDEPSAAVNAPATNPVGLDISDAPIVASRRYRDQLPVASGSDEDTVEVEEPAAVAPTIIAQAQARAQARARDGRRARIEPTLGDQIHAGTSAPAQALAPAEHAVERPLERSMDRSGIARAAAPTAATAATSAVPTLSMSSTTPPPRRTERRKIIALRLAAATPRFTGAQLLEALQAEHLQHGKYDVFHRKASADASVFSVASMVEPGTFDPARMKDETYPGITMFAQFPGPTDALPAFNDMVTCARRLHERLGGALQDERGVPLTMHRVERLRQELRDFEQTHAHDGRHADAAPLTP